ncbi:MAG: WecB/TagA/CpsF family glycosyltransferase [Cyanobacteria bacterium J06643_13]
MIPTKKLLNVPVTCLPFEEQIMLILRWAKARDSKFVCLANVHMVMEAYKNRLFTQVLYQADLVTPDGKPLVLMLRRMGIFNQNQVAGMDVFLNLCDLGEKSGTKVYFLGSTPDILAKMKRRLNQDYPILQVVGMKSIPFVSIEEVRQNRDLSLVEEINQSGAEIIFVCLGCPKQEIWMAQYQGAIKGVMIGVGAVFSMYAGLTPRAPSWIQRAGLEWLFRLIQEPRRLWRRYGSTIPPFVYLALSQLFIPQFKAFGAVKQSLLERNMVVDVETLDFSSEKLGEILIRQNILTRDELEQALMQQMRSNNKLGEILVRTNQISLSQLKFYLKNQSITLGQLLLEKKILKQRSLNNILRLQHGSQKKIGEILLEQEIVSKDKLQEILIEQYVRRKGLFLTSNEIEGQSQNNTKKLVVG